MTEPLVAIVVGGASGIGCAGARRLAADGFAVAVLDQNLEGAAAVASDINDGGGTSLSGELDVSDDRQVADVFGRVVRELGAPYAVVNSAGILDLAPALDITPQQWRRLIDVNLTGTFLCAQAAARTMIAGNVAGRIVNIASVHSQAPGRGLAHYDASKGGIWMLTKNLALELAPHGIAVNAIGPGLVRTNLGGGSDPEYLRQIIPTIPFKRAGQPEDIAGPISFLCSPDASYITGAMLYVDGGMLLTTQV